MIINQNSSPDSEPLGHSTPVNIIDGVGYFFTRRRLLIWKHIFPICEETPYTNNVVCRNPVDDVWTTYKLRDTIWIIIAIVLSKGSKSGNRSIIVKTKSIWT